MDSYMRASKPLQPRRQEILSKPFAKESVPRCVTVAPTEWSELVTADAEGMQVHLLTTDDVEQCLRLFDLNLTYGPFTGIDRMDRWIRASEMGLSPPQIVKQMIELVGEDGQRREGGHLW